MIVSRIKFFLAEDALYFKSCEKDIVVQNNHMLVDGTIVYAGVLLFYTIFTIVTDQPLILRQMYFIFDAIHLIVALCILIRPRRLISSLRATQIYCALLEITILCFFALEGVFTSKTSHSLYIPIAILLTLLLFIHRALYSSLLILVYVLVYAVSSCLYKTQEAYMNDVYIAIATFLASNIGYVLIAKMRHKAGNALHQYEILSKTDQLTGLLNKAAILDCCEHSFVELSPPCALVMLDLDNFKAVNDTYGHETGDEVLHSVGQALRLSFREIDSIGRFGGDEFIVVMQCDDFEIILERVQDVIQRISALRFSDENLKIQCSVGITLKKETDDPHSILSRADKALYEAKAKGKGNYHIL